MRHTSTPTTATIVALLVGIALLLDGCGGEEGVSDASDGPLLGARSEVLLSAVAGMTTPADERVAARVEPVAGTEPGGDILIDYPLEGSVFPPDMVAPTFLWHDDGESSDAWLIEVQLADGQTIRVLSAGPPPPRGEIDPVALGPTNEVYEPTPEQASAHSWTPSVDVWAAIQRGSSEREATVSILGLATREPKRRLSVGAMTLTTSQDPVGAPIFYRDVPLMPNKGKEGVISPLSKNGLPLIAWRLRDLSKPRSRLLLTGMPSCANCHSFSLDGKTMGMDVDGPEGDKGSYMIAPVEKHMVITNDEVITWNAFADKPEGHKTIGFLSRISPTGRFAVTTLNESLYVSNFTNYKFLQVFYPTRGILAWTSAETGEMKALPGADDPEYVHCDPAWYPDGDDIVFARAQALDPNPPGRKIAEYAGDPNELKIQYDLYRMPFDEGRGGTPVPLAGASGNGMSNTFPKVSPDGKWIVFTKCRNGQLMRPDGRLWIVPAQGGEAREMRCNTSLMNSWHSFSPNGRWMVFSSKVNTPYTQIFLTHIDEDGNDTPPILIPNSTAANRAVNIPEFLNAEYEALIDIQVPAVNHHRYFGEGIERMQEGKFAEAAAILEKAVELDPEFSRALVNLGFCLSRLDRPGEARTCYERALAVNPDDALAHTGLGSLAEAEGHLDEAILHFKKALETDPRLYVSRRNLGLAFARQGRLDQALVHLRHALRTEPRDLEVHKTLVVLLLEHERTDQALPHLEALVAVDSDDVQARTLWAWILATNPRDELRDGEKAVLHAREACKQTQYRRPEPLDALAAAYAETGRFQEAVQTAERALPLARGGPLAAGLEKRIDLYKQGKPYRARKR